MPDAAKAPAWSAWLWDESLRAKLRSPGRGVRRCRDNWGVSLLEGVGQNV